MEVTFSRAQEQRLREFGYIPSPAGIFSDSAERDDSFRAVSAALVRRNTDRMRTLADRPVRCPAQEAASGLAELLVSQGYLEVSTPIMISSTALRRMGVDEEHPLHRQVFWLDDRRCLRPMLAPGLYTMMSRLRRSVRGPVRLFEVGPCFRKETHGNRHLEEFTMLNLVEMSPEGGAVESLRSRVGHIMAHLGMDYGWEEERSEVYGSTYDVVVNGMEVASGAVGPHPLDEAHDVREPWFGIGFGIERLVQSKRGEQNIKRVGRSLVYVHGIRADM